MTQIITLGDLGHFYSDQGAVHCILFYLFA